MLGTRCVRRCRLAEIRRATARCPRGRYRVRPWTKRGIVLRVRGRHVRPIGHHSCESPAMRTSIPDRGPLHPLRQFVIASSDHRDHPALARGTTTTSADATPTPWRQGPRSRTPPPGQDPRRSPTTIGPCRLKRANVPFRSLAAGACAYGAQVADFSGGTGVEVEIVPDRGARRPAGVGGSGRTPRQS